MFVDSFLVTKNHYASRVYSLHLKLLCLDCSDIDDVAYTRVQVTSTVLDISTSPNVSKLVMKTLAVDAYNHVHISQDLQYNKI